jgi:hypothetical protein
MNISTKDAKALLAVTVGDEPLVPEDARQQGEDAIVAATLKRLAGMKERARVLHGAVTD